MPLINGVMWILSGAFLVAFVTMLGTIITGIVVTRGIVTLPEERHLPYWQRKAVQQRRGMALYHEARYRKIRAVMFGSAIAALLSFSGAFLIVAATKGLN